MIQQLKMAVDIKITFYKDIIKHKNIKNNDKLKKEREGGWKCAKIKNEYFHHINENKTKLPGKAQ